MRISILLSMAVVAFNLLGDAQAQLQVPQTLNGCVATAPDQPSQDCYSGIQDCYTNSSGNEQSWQNCIGIVENAYLAAQTPSNAPSSAPAQQGILVPTESDYYDIDGNKGWENTSQP